MKKDDAIGEVGPSDKGAYCCPVGPRGEEGEPGKTWWDLAADICRQRMIVEGTLHNIFLPENMTTYCYEISDVLNMHPVGGPICNHDPVYGWCAYMHWKESGMHIYAWDERIPPFFSIDIYTCKSFEPRDVIEYTREFFGENLIQLVWKE